MRINLHLTLPLLTALLLGCSEVPPRKIPAPVISGGQRSAPEVPAPSAPVRRPPVAGNTTPNLRPPVEVEPPVASAPASVRPPRDLSGQPVAPQQLITQPEEETLGIGTRRVTDDPNTRIAQYQSTAPSEPSPAHSRTVTTLLAIAERQATAGEFGAAALQVQRAIDLESRNADLWHRLAQLRLAQGELENAERAAHTSNELAGGNLPLRRENWRLISEVRFELGDAAAGEQAARMVEELY